MAGRIEQNEIKSDVGRERICRHEPNRFRFQNAHAVKLAAVEQHLAEA